MMEFWLLYHPEQSEMEHFKDSQKKKSKNEGLFEHSKQLFLYPPFYPPPPPPPPSPFSSSPP